MSVMKAEEKLEDLETLNAELEGLDASARVRWAVNTFGDELVLSTSFGIQSALMLHLVSQVKADVPVVFIDTGYLFPETYRFAEELTERLGLNLKVYTPLMTAARQEALYGKRWEQDRKGLEAYGLDNKAEPMNRALKELGATCWLSGLRRVQSSTRANRAIVEKQARTYKVHPVIDWTEKDVYYYFQKHDLPYHPLWNEGYVSVGDWHSTTKLEPGMDAEQTRFNGVKRECGLHESSGQADWQI